jgi:osmoprotectant transport system ATP-binding protein
MHGAPRSTVLVVQASGATQQTRILGATLFMGGFLECHGQIQHTIWMLILSRVSKHYGDAIALAPTDLAVPAGETTVLIGPSGCGKSTLLRLIVGLIQPTSGTITLRGTVLTPANIPQMRQRMGYVIQEGGLFPHLSVRENVTVMARYLRRNSDWIVSRLAELAQVVRLPLELMNRFPTELSGGQRQRVSLMRALMLEPELLLLDEPLGALDPMIRYELQQELKSIFSQLGNTVVMVTHDIAEAAFFGHTLALMRDGRIVQTGPFKALARTPAETFVTRFINAQREPMEQLGKVLE